MTTVDDITRIVLEGARSDFNRWCAGVTLGYSPTSLEALSHFLSNGGYVWALSVLGIQDRNQTCTYIEIGRYKLADFYFRDPSQCLTGIFRFWLRC